MKSPLRVWLALAAVVLPLCLCSSPVKIQVQASMDDYARLPRNGAATISGEVAARTKGGESRSIAGLFGKTIFRLPQ